MARGFTLATYETDQGGHLAVQIDAELALQPQRGWADPALPPAAGLPFRPIRSFLRRVYGVSPTTGRRGYAIVASLRADLWTGVSMSFDIETSDSSGLESIDTMVVTRRRGESFGLSR